VSYQFRAVEEYWRNFYALTARQKKLVREKWEKFKLNPFDPSLGTHRIHGLSARTRHTIYSVVIEGNLRVLFRVDGDMVTTLDVGTHDLYQ